MCMCTESGTDKAERTSPSHVAEAFVVRQAQYKLNAVTKNIDRDSWRDSWTGRTGYVVYDSQHVMTRRQLHIRFTVLAYGPQSCLPGYHWQHTAASC